MCMRTASSQREGGVMYEELSKSRCCDGSMLSRGRWSCWEDAVLRRLKHMNLATNRSRCALRVTHAESLGLPYRACLVDPTFPLKFFCNKFWEDCTGLCNGLWPSIHLLWTPASIANEFKENNILYHFRIFFFWHLSVHLHSCELTSLCKVNYYSF